MAKDVKIYSTPSCVYCKMAKELFNQNKIEYKDLNVAQDLEARKEMVDKSGQMGVPVIDIDGSIVVGFDENRLKELLAIK